MSNREDDEDNFKQWLGGRVQDAKLTPGEVEEFTSWLMSRSCDTKHEGTKVSFKEVLELASWFGSRMTSVFFKGDEREELSGWLSDRLQSHSCLSEDELKQIQDELREKQ